MTDDGKVVPIRDSALYLAGIDHSVPFEHEQGGERDAEPIVPRTNAPTPSISVDPAAVLDRWTVDGPLVHEPTGIASLDAQTGGGLVYGTTTYLQGAPDASKTTVLVHIAHMYALRNIAVGLIAADEEASDIVMRLAQRVGFQRDDLEKRDHGAIAVLRSKIGGLPLRFFNAEATLEQAAEDLARFASGRRMCLCVDSIQVVRCAIEVLAERPPIGHAAIESRTIALRALAWKHDLIAITTSEQSRAAYRSRKPEDQIDPLAAGKGSSGIEYKSRVLITMRKVPRLDDVVDCFPTRNKLQRGPKESLFLRIDRPRQTLEEIPAPADQDEEQSAEEAAARAKRVEARDAEDERKIESLAVKFLGALVQANARGAVIKNRLDFLGLIRGEQRLKGKALSLLITSGRISGGSGRPFAPRHGVTDGANGVEVPT